MYKNKEKQLLRAATHKKSTVSAVEVAVLTALNKKHSEEGEDLHNLLFAKQVAAIQLRLFDTRFENTMPKTKNSKRTVC